MAQRASNTLNTILWITQALLAVTFIWAAYMKLFAPSEKLHQMWPWTTGNENLVTLTGLVDLMAGAGLVLPALPGIQPKLTIYASYGVIVLMIAASVFHISREEVSKIGFNIVVALLAVFIAWGRQTKMTRPEKRNRATQ